MNFITLPAREQQPSPVYPAEIFAARRLLRMNSPANKAITRQAERIALDAMQTTSTAHALALARRFIRQASRPQHSDRDPPPPVAA